MCESVKCPNGCLISTGVTSATIVPKEIQFVTGETSERNYCENCGAELDEVEDGGPTLVS